jgi:hypothetical protein
LECRIKPTRRGRPPGRHAGRHAVAGEIVEKCGGGLLPLAATDQIDAFDDDKPHGSVVAEAASFEDATEFGASETPNTSG